MEFDMSPEVFGERAAACLRAMHPEYSIELNGQKSLLVNGRRLDIEELYRICAQDKERDTANVIKNYFTNLFDMSEVGIGRLPLASVRHLIMPRIQSVNIFDRLNRKNLMHIPFVNNTVVVFVEDCETKTVSLTMDSLAKWGTTIEEIEHIARENLETRTLSYLEVMKRKDDNVIASFRQNDGYDASRLLLSGLHSRLSPRLGREFYVAIPNRDMFVAFPFQPIGLVNKILTMVKQSHEQKAYPITPDLFYVTRDGVSGTINDSV